MAPGCTHTHTCTQIYTHTHTDRKNERYSKIQDLFLGPKLLQLLPY